MWCPNVVLSASKRAHSDYLHICVLYIQNSNIYKQQHEYLQETVI